MIYNCILLTNSERFYIYIYILQMVDCLMFQILVQALNQTYVRNRFKSLRFHQFYPISCFGQINRQRHYVSPYVYIFHTQMTSCRQQTFSMNKQMLLYIWLSYLLPQNIGIGTITNGNHSSNDMQILNICFKILIIDDDVSENLSLK